MKRLISIKQGYHQWEKTNLITTYVNGKPVDKMVCKKCGIKGLRFKLDEIEVDGRYSAARVEMCEGYHQTRRIKIIQCTAQGPQFANLTPGSLHDIVDPPRGENAKTGVWVMGVGESVKVLFNEFTFVE